MQIIVDGNSYNFSLLLKGGYYTGDYGILEASYNVYQEKFSGIVFRDPDTERYNFPAKFF